MTASRNIRNISSYIRGLWDWTFLNDCFRPTRIRVADVDGFVERRGHFLLIEAKPERDDSEHEISIGQRLTHEALHRNGAFTVMTVWGHTRTDVADEHLSQSDTTAMICALGTPVPTYIRVWPENGEPYECTTDLKHFQEIVRDWFLWADKNPKR